MYIKFTCMWSCCVCVAPTDWISTHFSCAFPNFYIHPHHFECHTRYYYKNEINACTIYPSSHVCTRVCFGCIHTEQNFQRPNMRNQLIPMFMFLGRRRWRKIGFAVQMHGRSKMGSYQLFEAVAAIYTDRSTNAPLALCRWHAPSYLVSLKNKFYIAPGKGESVAKYFSGEMV